MLESGGDPNAISSQGAVGLMQVMPRDTGIYFECVNGDCFANRPTTEELLDPVYNIEYGSNLLWALIVRNGNIKDGLFNYGPSGVGYEGYADRIISLTQKVKNGT